MPLLFILVPLAVVIVLNIFPVLGRRRAIYYCVLTVLVVQLAASLTLGASIWARLSSSFSITFVTGLSFNSISSLMLFIIALVVLSAVILKSSEENNTSFNFYNLTLLILMGMNGVVMSEDIFSMYVFLEITAVSSYILIGLYREKPALEGSFKYVIMSSVASVLILGGIALLMLTAGTLRFDEMMQAVKAYNNGTPYPILISAVLFLAGLSIKAGLVPFHGWLPDAYTSAPAPVSVLLAGIVTKIAGVYSLLIIFKSVLSWSVQVGQVLAVFGTVSIVTGATLAMSVKDMKRMLAYSSISQIGYIVLAIGINTPLALLGAVFHFFNHATFKSLLFVNSAAVEQQTKTRKLEQLGGLSEKMPVTGVTSVIGFLSTAGIPPLAGFWSKLIIIVAVFEANQYGYAVIALLASILTLGYFLRLQRKVFFGTLSIGLEQVKEAGNNIRFVSIMLAAIIVLVGVLFPFIYKYVQWAGLL